MIIWWKALVIYAQTELCEEFTITNFDNKDKLNFFPVSWTSASEALRIYEKFYIQILKFWRKSNNIVEHLFLKTQRGYQNHDNKAGIWPMSDNNWESAVN